MKNEDVLSKSSQFLGLMSEMVPNDKLYVNVCSSEFESRLPHAAGGCDTLEGSSASLLLSSGCSPSFHVEGGRHASGVLKLEEGNHLWIFILLSIILIVSFLVFR